MELHTAASALKGKDYAFSRQPCSVAIKIKGTQACGTAEIVATSSDLEHDISALIEGGMAVFEEAVGIAHSSGQLLWQHLVAKVKCKGINFEGACNVPTSLKEHILAVARPTVCQAEASLVLRCFDKDGGFAFISEETVLFARMIDVFCGTEGLDVADGGAAFLELAMSPSSVFAPIDEVVAMLGLFTSAFDVASVCSFLEGLLSRQVSCTIYSWRRCRPRDQVCNQTCRR